MGDEWNCQGRDELVCPEVPSKTVDTRQKHTCLIDTLLELSRNRSRVTCIRTEERIKGSLWHK